MKLEEAKTLADLRDKELQATDFNDAVEVVHLDGSTFLYKSGVLEAHGKFLFAFSEHHHPDVFFLGDLKRWGFTKEKVVPNIKRYFVAETSGEMVDAEGDERVGEWVRWKDVEPLIGTQA